MLVASFFMTIMVIVIFVAILAIIFVTFAKYGIKVFYTLLGIAFFAILWSAIHMSMTQ